MDSTSLINKTIIKNNTNLRTAQKIEKKKYKKGSRKNLKNYLGKVLLPLNEVIGEEVRITSFIPTISREKLLLKLEKANITGMSGNNFLIHEKIQSFLLSSKENRTLLINAVECDPGLVHDSWILENRALEINKAVTYLADALDLNKVVLATAKSDIKVDCKFSVKIVPARYPMGEEHFLIKQVLDSSLKKEELPTNHGILVLNIQSIYQICKIVNGCFDYGRFITVADLSIAHSKVAYVKPNDTVFDVLNKSFDNINANLPYKGYGIMDCLIAKSSDTFSNNENFIAYSPLSSISIKNKCIKCRRCTKRCPVNIKVHKIVQIMEIKNTEVNIANSTKECLHCGSCTYYCPASKNIANSFR